MYNRPTDQNQLRQEAAKQAYELAVWREARELERKQNASDRRTDRRKGSLKKPG